MEAKQEYGHDLEQEYALIEAALGKATAILEVFDNEIRRLRHEIEGIKREQVSIKEEIRGKKKAKEKRGEGE